MAYEFVVTAQGNLSQGNMGGGTALCMSRVQGDPMLLAVAQDGGQDILHRLSRADFGRYKAGRVDASIRTVIGMDTDGYKPEDVYCIEGTQFRDMVHVISSETGQITHQIRLEDSPVWDDYGSRPDGFCMDEKNFYITFADQIAVFERNGRFDKLVDQPRGRINGMTRLKDGFLVVSAQRDTMLMLDGNLNAMEEIDIPSSLFPSIDENLGLHAVAMDYYGDMALEPKIWLPNGTIELEPYPNAIQQGWHSDHNPHCDWVPEPARRFGRHKLYIADRTLSRLYQGYLIDA